MNYQSWIRRERWQTKGKLIVVISFLFGSHAVTFRVGTGNCILIIVALLQARALISRLTDEKNNAIQQNSKLRQELVRIYNIYVIFWQV